MNTTNKSSKSLVKLIFLTFSTLYMIGVILYAIGDNTSKKEPVKQEISSSSEPYVSEHDKCVLRGQAYFVELGSALAGTSVASERCSRNLAAFPKLKDESMFPTIKKISMNM